MLGRKTIKYLNSRVLKLNAILIESLLRRDNIRVSSRRLRTIATYWTPANAYNAIKRNHSCLARTNEIIKIQYALLLTIDQVEREAKREQSRSSVLILFWNIRRYVYNRIRRRELVKKVNKEIKAIERRKSKISQIEENVSDYIKSGKKLVESKLEEFEIIEIVIKNTNEFYHELPDEEKEEVEAYILHRLKRIRGVAGKG